jgi:hypothetical protein
MMVGKILKNLVEKILENSGMITLKILKKVNTEI